MAEAVSGDGELQAVKPPPKRRRILDPSAIVPVPIYSNKVSSSLQLKPAAAVFAEKENADDDDDDGGDDGLWSQFSSRGRTRAAVSLSDSEEDEERAGSKAASAEKTSQREAPRCPSPPPPESPVQKQSRRVKEKISKIDRELQAVNSLLCPEPQPQPQARRSRRHRRRGPPPTDPAVAEDDDDDVVVVCHVQDSPYSSSVREIPLKVRCRTDVHKIPVLSSTPLSDVVTRLSAILSVPPPRLLLLREEVELPEDSTVGELGLGIADIIECVVMAAEDKDGAAGGGGGGGSITVRLQSKDRDSSQEFSLHRDAALGSIFSQYLSKMSAKAQRKVCFHFDGSKVAHSQTPAQLDMEDGDIIEVWT